MLNASMVGLMCARKSLSWLCDAVRKFRSCNAGNIAITFALATLPIIGSVGFAVDYSSANSAKADMQAALDSTALMLAKEAATDTTSQLQTDASKFFAAMFNRPQATNITISATYTSSGGSQVLVNGTASIPTHFLGIIGYNSLTINGSSTAKWGMSRLRVALVLDNTGSMADSGKITALKTATNNLLSQLNAAATTNGDVYVSIIPFVKDVNVGATNYASSWIDWTDWNTANQTCSGGSGWSGGWGWGRTEEIIAVRPITTLGMAASLIAEMRTVPIPRITTQMSSRQRQVKRLHCSRPSNTTLARRQQWA